MALKQFRRHGIFFQKSIELKCTSIEVSGRLRMTHIWRKTKGENIQSGLRWPQTKKATTLGVGTETEIIIGFREKLTTGYFTLKRIELKGAQNVQASSFFGLWGLGSGQAQAYEFLTFRPRIQKF